MSEAKASISLAQLAAGEDIRKWNPAALEKLATEIGVPQASSLDKPGLLAAIQARVEEHHRAVEPEPPGTVAKAYRVVGPHTVHGTKPGKTFAAVLPPDQEAALIEGGHIKIEKEG